jgi:hypothetical protein
MKTQVNVKLLFVFLAVAAMSCKNNSKSGSNAFDNLTDRLVDKQEAVEEVIGYPIPTSYEVTTMLNDAGAPYIIGINNPTDNVKKYLTTKDRAINLGIYGADLSYASTYNLKQETRDYLHVSQELIDELQIESAFNHDFAKKVEENLENKDSLISIITDSFYDTYSYLRKNKQDVTSVLIVAGSWIESVYITSQIIITSNDKEPFITILENQKNSLEQLLEVLEPVKEDMSVADIYAKLKEMEKIYEGFESPVATEQINVLTTQIEELRGSLV